MNTAPVLSIVGASKIFQSGESEIVALDNVSLDIFEGEVLGIVGPSGSGKTTLLMIAGLIETPTTGYVRFLGDVLISGGTQLNTLTDMRRQNIGFVFQRANLIPFLTALENVQLAMQLDGAPSSEAHARATELLDELGLMHRAGNLPRQLSGGEQQRVAIARALANRPIIVFADEPTAALDSARGRKVMELFVQMARQQNVAVVVVTHDVRVAALVDRIVEMTDGRISSERMNENVFTQTPP